MKMIYLFMAMNLPHVASTLSLKTRREYIPVALETASDRQGWRKCRYCKELLSALLSTVLKNRVETTCNLQPAAC